MIPPEGRRYDRATVVAAAPGATHRICTGWKGDAAHPSKLGGIVITRNSLNGSGKGRPIDMQCMRRLGFDNEAEILKAIRAGTKAPPGSLPDTLTIEIVSNPTWSETAGWNIASIYDDDYSDKGKGLGFRCRGNGVTASELQKDMTRKIIQCNPIGKRGCLPQDYCIHSVKGDCKCHLTFVCRLHYRESDGRWRPLSSIPGSLFVWKSTSEPSGVRIADAILKAAERLKVETPTGFQGMLSGIKGTLAFNLESREYKGKDGRETAIMGGFSLLLDSDEIERREALIWAQAREMSIIRLTSREPKALLAAPAEADEAPGLAAAELASAELDDFDDGFDAPEPNPAPNPAEDSNPPRVHGEPSRGMAADQAEDSFPFDDAAPAKMTLKEIGTMFRAKFARAGLGAAAAKKLIEDQDFDPARIERDLDEIIAVTNEEAIAK
jgi:hypothetical protein